MSYKCKVCKGQSKKNVTQAKIVTKVEKLKNGGTRTLEEKCVCHPCKNKLEKKKGAVKK